MTPEEKSKEFKERVRELIGPGELNPTDADAGLERLVAKAMSFLNGELGLS